MEIHIGANSNISKHLSRESRKVIKNKLEKEKKFNKSKL